MVSTNHVSTQEALIFNVLISPPLLPVPAFRQPTKAWLTFH
jgi:hypothetical protein